MNVTGKTEFVLRSPVVFELVIITKCKTFTKCVGVFTKMLPSSFRFSIQSANWCRYQTYFYWLFYLHEQNFS